MTAYLATLRWLVTSALDVVERWPTTTWFLTACWPLTFVLLVATGMRLW
ncbi:hypothetical protein GCM10023201_40820 [Actinomycetospora corticicola]|uniref:Uncharacterized protein n=1 Tax=Actinomycetospora corticicola TaxID=663602 RepID=A0A7Y9J6W2_9PSEU|nr:hypothetical protein [Actinomycetospora corticicola]NYD36834.1 hypothetical protein [Actinomycetospora corticicola]